MRCSTRSSPSPLYLAFGILDLLQRGSHFHAAYSDHPWILYQCVRYYSLCRSRAIESHNEVVAAVIIRLVFVYGFGEEKGAPICNAANDAASVNDQLADSQSYTERDGSLVEVRDDWKGEEYG